jgi:hypothetical protein
MHVQSTLTKDRVVEYLTEQLARRRALAARQNAAYSRLAEHVFLGSVGPLRRPHPVPGSVVQFAQTAA